MSARGVVRGLLYAGIHLHSCLARPPCFSIGGSPVLLVRPPQHILDAKHAGLRDALLQLAEVLSYWTQFSSASPAYSAGPEAAAVAVALLSIC